MKNSRSAVAGLVNSKNVDIEIAKLSQFVCYSILSEELFHEEQIKLLQKYGFETVNYKIVKKIDEPTLESYLKDRRHASLYDIDGIVCGDDSQKYKHSGNNPLFAFAFKMVLADQKLNAIVVQVIWTPTSYKYIKPKIEIKPVEIGGTSVTFATAHNAKFIEENIIGPGAEIEIIRSGDVIPYILSVIKPASSGKPQMPSLKYKWNNTKVDIILDDNTEDNIVNIKVIEHFFRKMGVKWMSEGIITKLVDNDFDSIHKILTAKKNDLINIDGIGEKLVDKIFIEINRAFKEIKLEKFMAASHTLGRALGEKKLAEIVKVYPNILTNTWSHNEIINNVIEINGFSDKLGAQ